MPVLGLMPVLWLMLRPSSGRPGHRRQLSGCSHRRLLRPSSERPGHRRRQQAAATGAEHFFAHQQTVCQSLRNSRYKHKNKRSQPQAAS